MKKRRRLRAGWIPWSAGLCIFLGFGAGCGDFQGGDLSSPGRAAEAPPATVNQQTPTDTPTVMARAADVYPADIRAGSSDQNGQLANGGSYGASLSENGRYLAFYSKAGNLVDTPNNGQTQVYRKDLETGEVVLISGDWQAGDGPSERPQISDDGMKIAFRSKATNLPAVNPSDGQYYQVYLAEFDPYAPPGYEAPLQFSLQSRIAGSGWSSNPVAGDGDSILDDFGGNSRLSYSSKATNLDWSDQDNVWDVYERNLEDDSQTLISLSADHQKGNGSSKSSSIGEDGKFRYFISSAWNMIGPGGVRPSLQYRDDMGQALQIPLSNRKAYDVEVAENNRNAFAVTLQNTASGGYQSCFFKSSDPYWPDDIPMDESIRQEVQLATDCSAQDAVAVSDDGRFVVYKDRDRAELGDQDGNYDIFLYDAQNDTHYQVSKDSPNNGHAQRPAISDDGSTIAWDQGGKVWVTGNPALGAAPPALPQVVSTSSEGELSNAGWDGVGNPTITDDGRFLTFLSKATNLHPDATSGDTYLYRKDLYTGDLVVVSRRNQNQSAAEAETEGWMSEDGNLVVFGSRETDLGDYQQVPSSNWFSYYLRNVQEDTTTFLFNKGRVLDLAPGPDAYTPYSLFFWSYGSENDHPMGIAEGLKSAYLGPYFYDSPVDIPSWMTMNYTIQAMKVTDDQNTLFLVLSNNASGVHSLWKVGRFGGYYGSQSYEMIADSIDYQHFDISADGETVAYTQRENNDPTRKRLVVSTTVTNPYGYSYPSQDNPTQTQATYPHLSADGRYLLYYDSNYPMGASQGSGADAYVYDTVYRISLPLREESVSYPGSLRLSHDGRSVIFEDYDYTSGTQLCVVKNPHIGLTESDYEEMGYYIPNSGN